MKLTEVSLILIGLNLLKHDHVQMFTYVCVSVLWACHVGVYVGGGVCVWKHVENTSQCICLCAFLRVETYACLDGEALQ